MSTPKYIIKTCLLFKTRTCNWPKLNRIIKTKILPFKLCPICIVLEAESVIEPLRVLVSNAVLFSSKPSTKKLISVWCTCKNYHCYQVHKLLLVLTSCQQPSCLFFQVILFFLNFLQVEILEAIYFNSKTISLHVTYPDMNLYSEMFMLWWCIPGYWWDNSICTLWVPWNMFLNTNAIMVILENKLIHKGKDIQTQIYPDILMMYMWVLPKLLVTCHKYSFL